jgi:uncharacterized membrane-anchored protein
MIALYIITYLFIGLAIYALMIYLEYTDLVDLDIMEDEDKVWAVLALSIFLWPLLIVLMVFAFIPFEITMRLKAKKDAKR